MQKHQLRYLSEIKKGLIQKEINGMIYYSVPMLDDLGVKNGFMARKGGVSPAPFDSLNFSMKREGSYENFITNFSIMADNLGLNVEDMGVCNYEHGTNVEFVSDEHKGMGIVRDNELPYCDGLIVQDSGITAVSLHADCVPILFADKKLRAAGTCHAGWRGVLGGAVFSILDKLALIGIEPEDVCFGVAPCIHECCFEVQDDVSVPFVAEYGEIVRERREGKQYIDLRAVIGLQLMRRGVPAENVSMSNLCTCCLPDLFFSFRRDGLDTGDMACVIALP